MYQPIPRLLITMKSELLYLHCPKSNQNLHEIFRVVSRFLRYIYCYFAEN